MLIKLRRFSPIFLHDEEEHVKLRQSKNVTEKASTCTDRERLYGRGTKKERQIKYKKKYR